MDTPLNPHQPAHQFAPPDTSPAPHQQTPPDPDLDERPPDRSRLPDPCSATTRAGTPCRFAARKDTGLCINHDPSYAHEQRYNTLKGVQNSLASRATPRIRLHAVDLTTRAGVQALLDAVIRLYLEGRLPENRARNLIRALSIASRNFDPPSERARALGYPTSHDSTYYDSLRYALDRHLRALPSEPRP